MITDHEIQTLELSATKRDFYQIWNELLETASKLSERWDPTSTNESDPGIVLLKVLTAVADKLNYQIDKNTLESFLPTAAQTESVRKLCELVGYDMKYFQSGKTSASIKWVGGVNHTNKTLVDAGGKEFVNITLPRFTVLKNTGGDVVYSTTESWDFGYNNRENFVDCIEGAVIPCTTDSGNIVTINLLDDNHRYYLPEAQVAENGIFIYNIAVNGEENAEQWKKVSNLNTQPLGSHVYKIGYGSKLGLLYIQFPEDISTLIEDGLAIYFTRTRGANGNIAAKTLTTLETPKEWAGQTETTSSLNETLFSVSNKNAAMNGMNPETNTQAYNNYKKIIGTFDTLVTCRDYMNKIYQLYDELDVPVVSNIIVSDIRDDINRTVQLCSFNEYGINYADLPINLGTDTLSNFDLIIYPFKTVYGLNTKTEYRNSFTCDFEKNNLIEYGLSKNKAISHNLINPNPDEIACIKNYLKLTAKITTTTKVNIVAQKNILETIYKAIYANFNARQLDFGEDIPFDNILACIQTADSRIKNVSLEEPKIVTKICRVDGFEKFIDEDEEGRALYNKLAIRNILAGKVPLFNYNETFKPDLSEKAVAEPSLYTGVQTLKSSCEFPVAGLPEGGEKLAANEFIQFRAPNFRTSITYPAYVNYFAVLNQNGGNDAVAAKFLTLRSFFMANPTMWLGPTGIITTKFNTLAHLAPYKNLEIDSDITLDSERFKYGEIFIWVGGAWQIASTTFISGTDYYYCPLISTTFSAWYTWIKGLTHGGGKYLGLCSQLLQNMERPLGYLVDDEHYKYKELTQPLSIGAGTALDNYYIQDTSVGVTNNFGLGISATIIGIATGGEYKLGTNECIYFNYTNSSTNAANTDTTVVKNVYYGPGSIIKPNFNLKDSAALKMDGKVFTKTVITGTNFVDASGNAGMPLTLPDGTTGMFSLGGGEQIEIREPIIVNFSPATDSPSQTSKNINVYWETTSKSKTFSFPDAETDGHSYTLKEGEYFFYTDANKTDLVWYGSGTKIYQYGNLELVKAETADEVSIEDILENGLDIIPWIKLTVTGNNYLTVHEYQYITLTTGDALNTIAFPDGVTPPTLTNTFVPCTSANYTLGGTTQNLPQITAEPASWEVRSGLMFNVGPVLTQTLQNERDKITIKIPGQEDETKSGIISFKTNYPCQTTAHEVNVSVDSDGKSLIPAFSLELFNKQDIKAVFDSTEIILPLNNFGDLWTKFTFAQLDSTKTKSPTIDLHVKLQSNQYGLLMFYYKPANPEHRAYLTIDAGASPLVIFNNVVDLAEAWWEAVVAGKYPLKEGINIVKIPTSCALTIHKADDVGEIKYGYEDTIIFGNLDIVNGTADAGLNMALLDYQGTAAELLAEINVIDTGHAFYYNNVLDNNNVIDLNIASGQTLSSSLSWYDYNNANNKFVISEIDADYLEEGITIARTSKL